MDKIHRMQYNSPDEACCLAVAYHSGTLWLSLRQMAALFQVPMAAIEAQLKTHDAFSQAVPESYYLSMLPDTRTAEICPEDERVAHYRFEWVLLVGHSLEQPYFQHLVQWATQQIALGMAMEKVVAKYPTTPSSGLPHGYEDEDNDWLEDWREADKSPLLESDDPKVWRVLEAHWLRKPLRFIYWGGSEPGEVREVIPKEVFQAEGYRAIWFRGDCPQRGEERTFKIDKVEFE